MAGTLNENTHFLCFSPSVLNEYTNRVQCLQRTMPEDVIVVGDFGKQPYSIINEWVWGCICVICVLGCVYVCLSEDEGSRMCVQCIVLCLRKPFPAMCGLCGTTYFNSAVLYVRQILHGGLAITKFRTKHSSSLTATPSITIHTTNGANAM